MMPEKCPRCPKRRVVAYDGLGQAFAQCEMGTMNVAYQAIRALTTLVILTLPAFGQATGIITTAAGNGTGSYTGDGGPAVSATINSPTGVTVDPQGNLYISDYLNSVIRKVDASGNISTVAGCGPSVNCLVAGPGDGGPATAGSVAAPFDVVADSAGNLYMSDSGRNSVRKVDKNGTISTFAGGKAAAGFSGDGGKAVDAALNDPVGLAVDGSGNLYIADLVNNRIRKVDTGGIITTVAGNGTLGYSGDGGRATDAALNNPHGVAVDAGGNIYISDTNNFVVRKVDQAGVITTFAGNGTVTTNPNGSRATEVALVSPWGLAVDKAGNLYIGEFLGYRVRKVDPAGNITTVAGNGTSGFSGDGGPATSAMMWALNGIALDGNGNLYIADNLNNRVRKVSQPHVAPSVNDLGVVNNASFAAGSNPVAPGTIVAVFGTNLNDGSTTLSSSFGPNGTLVTTLGGAQFKVNGTPVPIFYSTPSQLGVQVPTSLTGASATIAVEVAGQASVSKTILLDTFAPGIFSVNQSGHGQGAILFANTNTLVAPSGSIPGRDARPAKPGDFLTIFCTGLGQVSPPLATGAPATSNTTVATPTVTIDGIPASVTFSGLAPGFVGLNQVNVQVPAGVRSADDVSVVLTIMGKQSNTVTIAVSGA